MQSDYRLVAQAWGAALCRFSTGGSTQSVQIAIAAVAGPGDTLLIAGNEHKVASSVAVYVGVDLVVLLSVVDRAIKHGIDPDVLIRALDDYSHAKAVLIIGPTFCGATSNIAPLANVCHARKVPHLVDAAWGAATRSATGCPRIRRSRARTRWSSAFTRRWARSRRAGLCSSPEA